MAVLLPGSCSSLRWTMSLLCQLCWHRDGEYTRPQKRERMKSEEVYQILLTWSERQQAVLAEAPEVPGCSAVGATYEAALAAIQEKMRHWVETTQRVGHRLPQREKRPLAEEQARLVARIRAEGRQTAEESGERDTLLDETGLQVYAARAAGCAADHRGY